MACELLYNSTKKKDLIVKVRSFLRTQNFEQFKGGLLKSLIPKETRFTLETSDSSTELHKSIISFYNDLKDITGSLIISNPKISDIIETLFSKIHSEFHIDADETLSASFETDIESKTLLEIHDKNRGNLEEHLKEIYGLESYDIIMSLGQDFYDDIINSSYYNIMTGEIVDMDNETLNKNIKNLKTLYLNKLKQYLQEQNIPFKDNPFAILLAFYAHIKSIDNFNTRLTKLLYEKIQLKHKEGKRELFGSLIETLESDPNFKTKVLKHLNEYKKNRLSEDLYSGDCYSPSYLSVKKYITKHRSDLLDKILKIESLEVNLLEAVNAYSKLSHFDELLVEHMGKQIAIQEGTKNIEIDDKYSYHHDTAHENKSWQTSEDISSEKHTSNFTKGVFSVIRIFDHRTGEFKNRRLSSTSFIIAARHLIDDIVYGNINIIGNLDFVKNCRNTILKDVVSFHNHPIENLLEILLLLFDTTEGVNSKPIKDYLRNKRLLTDVDLDILYSVYMKVFNKKDPTSFISQELESQYKNRLGASFMLEIAAYVDSNITMDYLETSIDWETGESVAKVKRKYFNSANLYKLRKAINSGINSKSLEAREKLQKEYQLEVREPIDSATEYLVKVGNETIILEVPNALDDAKILTSSSKKATVKFSKINNEYFKNLEDVDLIKYRQYTEGKATPKNDKERQNFNNLTAILKFVDDYLGLNISTNLGLHTLQVYKSIYSETNNMSNYLMPLVQLAIRAAYINNLYIKAGDMKLSEFLQNDPIYKHYKQFPKSKIFTESFGNVKYTAVSFADKALDMWVDAFSMLTGEASKATTKDGLGNSMPNNSVGKLGGILHYYTQKQKGTNCDSLMFVDRPQDIKATYHDLEASNIHKDIKSIKQFSCGELFFHSIFNKFWGNYNKSGRVIIQPTVYSDKTTFLNWEISTDLLDDPDYVSKVIKKYKESLGIFYKNVYEDTILKLNKLCDYYNRSLSEPLTLKQFLRNHNKELLWALLDLYNSDENNDKIDLEQDKDFRVRTKVITNEDGTISKLEYCTINEILEYNNRVYNNEELLLKALEQEKYNFLLNLIDYNMSFLVLNFLDNVSYYTSSSINSKATSKNPILFTILEHFKKVDARIEFFENWVDAKTGKLILAKQGDNNILGISGDFDQNTPGMKLNPLLDKFFYVEGLLSNNLRMSLTGSEINHPDKSKKLFFNIAKNSSDPIKFKINTGIEISSDDFNRIKTILNNCDDVTDLLQYLDDPIINTIYTKTITKIINTAQGTQFKRNVIIPATLQYCQQGTKNGIGRKIKCAVIEDELADVNNYRGETKTVDSADGSAKINPFLSILENLALGSQAVGFIKKPIWHSYDASSGTSFLAKFATNTITNESMRASMHSDTSLFRIFKLMTNLPWDKPIDLTKAIHNDKSFSVEIKEGDELSKTNAQIQKTLHEHWFSKVILENQNLYYKNKYGDIMQILMLNKTTTSDGTVYYYTEELDKFGNKTKVYHMFDGDSNHITFDSYQKALKYELELKGHTIKSLFELHTALGSINCVDSKGVSSEFNNKVVVNFMNNIGYKKEGTTNKDLVNQDTYVQPLKDYHIGYALNSTAVKNGAKNINNAEAWKGNTKLRYFEVDSDGLGMQMNADHDIVNSELTEFSQVIAATSAYGYTYDNCNETFKGLAKTAVEASKRVLDSVNKYLEDLGPQAQSDLYDAIGRIIMVEHSIKSKENLDSIIWEAITKVFNKHKDHRNDDIKIPFSDPNVYSDFVGTLGSVITKASIKRKHPGSGCVMVPGYNIITYFEIGNKKYSHTEILNKARNDLKTTLLLELLKTSKNYNKTESGFETYKEKPINRYSFKQLIDIILEEKLTEDEDIIKLLTTSDAIMFENNIVYQYLKKLLSLEPLYNKDYFQPEDVVRIILPKINPETLEYMYDDLGKLLTHETKMILNSMKAYYDFKDHEYPEGTVFLLDVTTPRNLKPSLIRWLYEIDKTTGGPITRETLEENIEVRYMNIFDHPVIKEAFKKKGKLDANYRRQIQEILNDLHAGTFTMNGVTYNILSESLENTEAELVMSNLYKEIFGVGEESLLEILDLGELYFINQIENNIHAPYNPIYDIAMLKDDGKHTLIKFGNVTPNEYCVEDNFKYTSVEEKVHKNTNRIKYNIYCMKGNKPLFKIGEYVDIEGEEQEDLFIEDNIIKSKSNKEVDQNLYRINNGTILKRIDFIQRYKVTTKKVDKKSGRVFYTTNTMYKLIDRQALTKLYGNDRDVHKQIGSLISNIYLLDNYKFMELNGLNFKNYTKSVDHIRSYMSMFLGNTYISSDNKDYLNALLDFIGNSKEDITKSFNFLNNLKKEFYTKEAHKKWVSFQDSLKFISSRIPAQTLQSFMTMKCIGWTENTKNMAYVSHFQTYLQGSDYDIDKAYIMGQSYDGNGQYIQWSPLFDFTDAKTLALSKQLPIPEPFELIKIEGGVDITEELNALLNNTNGDLEPLSYSLRLYTLQTKVNLIRKINKAEGKIYYNVADSSKLTKIFEMLKSHMYYKIPENISEAAYKNVASANIYNVSHDIRNRDLSYTAITMKSFLDAAENSPKGEQAATLNMLNPLTKYIMLYQNIVGKNVISIAANGEKIWFNAYYYWTKSLKNNKPKYLQFLTTLSRINGRAKIVEAKKSLSELQQQSLTINTLPDLNPYDEELRITLLEHFGVDLQGEQYAYVDQLISQLLSAATDNAKELILDKINSSNNFARMYIYLMMTGYNLDDIVSFMISPASGFIDSMANSNMFSDTDLNNSPYQAINLALGIVKSKSFLHGSIDIWELDETNGDTNKRPVSKNKYIFKALTNSKYIEEVRNVLGLKPEQEIENLDTLMQGYIFASIQNPNINIASLVSTTDTEINTYLLYCQNIVYKLSNVASKYENISEMQEDVKEFKKVYQLSSEISSIASAWLGLNQGLPTDELSLLKRFSSMRKIIIDRERALEIYPNKMFTDSKDPKVIEKTKKYYEKVIQNILDNNEYLDYVTVELAIQTAREKDLIGTFDVYRYLTDVLYRKDMIEYNHIIKGTLNVLDMMEEIPHYKETLECLKVLAVSKQALASKSRLVTRLLLDSKLDYLNDLQLKGIIRYVDKLNALNFAKSFTSPIVLSKTIEGFDRYFDKTKTDTIDLTTLEGISTFKHWVEHEFLEDLKDNHKDNSLVKHLQRVPENQREILATDIDLLNPNTTSITRLGFDEIISGMANFEKRDAMYKDTGYTIADILLLYNIVVNNNLYGSERLTTAFKACSNLNNILNKYFKFISDLDYDSTILQDYEYLDYLINAAPIVSTGAERFRTEPFIKVNDPVEGYILKKYDENTNSYEPYELIPAKGGIETNEHRLLRLLNFAEYCPFEMPAMAKVVEVLSAINFKGDITEDVLSRIKNILLDFSSIGKLIVFKDC